MVNRTLGGWWRLWIVLTMVYGGLVATYTGLSWPEVSHISHDPSFLKQMSPEALAIINRPKTLTDLEQAFVAADRASATENARKLAQEVRRQQELPEWERAPLVLSMPNGYEFQVAGDTKSDQANLVGRDYVRVLQSTASERRVTDVVRALFIWLVPSAILCALGSAVGWVFRGFKKGQP
jgi:hypothetical protein